MITSPRTLSPTKKSQNVHVDRAKKRQLWSLGRSLERHMKITWKKLKGPKSFLGIEAVKWMVDDSACPCDCVEKAVKLGQGMVDEGILRHVSLRKSLPFQNAPNFYCFTPEYRVMTRVKLYVSELKKIACLIAGNVKIEDRVFTFEGNEIEYPDCFTGNDAIDFMIANKCIPVCDKAEAEDLGNYMISKGLMSYGVNENAIPNLPFKTSVVYYAFSPEINPMNIEDVDDKLIGQLIDVDVVGSPISKSFAIANSLMNSPLSSPVKSKSSSKSSNPTKEDYKELRAKYEQLSAVHTDLYNSVEAFLSKVPLDKNNLQSDEYQIWKKLAESMDRARNFKKAKSRASNKSISSKTNSSRSSKKTLAFGSPDSQRTEKNPKNPRRHIDV